MWVPPAYSPLTLRAMVRGVLAGAGARAELEGSLREWYGADRALAAASGTQALQLALKAALRQAGGDATVALPAYTCYDVASAAVWAGAPVVFYDLDPLTLGPEPESFRRAAGNAGVLVVANLVGFPLDWDLIREVADARCIPVVEDAAQGLGAEWKGRPAGTMGDLSILSFGRGKGWTAGSGGAVLARGRFGESLPHELPPGPASKAREGARAGAVWVLARPSLYGIPARVPALGLGETHYRAPTEPRAISPFAAGLALAGRDRSLAEVEVRRRKAALLRERLTGDPAELALPEPPEQGRSGDLRLPVLIPGGGREHPRLGLYASYPRPLPELEPLQPLMARMNPCPGARRLARELITAPTHSRSGSVEEHVLRWLAAEGESEPEVSGS